jgi:hypothetical protein
MPLFFQLSVPVRAAVAAGKGPTADGHLRLAGAPSVRGLFPTSVIGNVGAFGGLLRVDADVRGIGRFVPFGRGLAVDALHRWVIIHDRSSAAVVLLAIT